MLVNLNVGSSCGRHGLTWLQVIANPSLETAALQAGFQCQPVSSGDQILEYYELFLSIPQSIGILLGFYGFFHVISYVALTLLYRQRR